jgi:hypothetical protein
MGAVETMEQLSAAALSLEGSLAHQLDGLPTKVPCSDNSSIYEHTFTPPPSPASVCSYTACTQISRR